ncbi:PRC-barrel domain-containing protein [Pelagicoccus albus]|uniref:PRC-barrel domain-containing protein n=1 Tax=Pelagicoccus albus TaxID=415222 RepID=A0A7X1E9Z6_9BACT|nr:PRC-barrel domain-containing protein [Pelagicoccus albus]MBC2607969.1 PRC-barrel domain-containing protein [Pelagicoccus albus]
MKLHKNTKTQINSSNFIKNTTAAALALTVMIPLSLQAHDHKSDATEKQESMAQAETSPKESYSGSDVSSADGSMPEEGQYSMESSEGSPKLNESASEDNWSEEMKKKANKAGDEAESAMSKHDMAMADQGQMAHKQHGEQNLQDFPKSFTSSNRVEIDSWMGVAVVEGENTELGEVEDVVVDLKSGEISHLVVDNPGLFAGSSLLSMQHAELKAAEGKVAAESSKAFELKDDYLRETEALGSKLIGSKVKDTEGRKIGKIDRLVIAPNSSSVYAILGNLDKDIEIGEADREIAVPVISLESDVEEDGYLTLFAVEELASFDTPSVSEDWSTAFDKGYIVISSEVTVASAY